jgi:hypothetical protein
MHDQVHKGVVLSSRHGLAHEYKYMARVVDSMQDLIARRLDSIYCDSEACACYVVMTRDGLEAPSIPKAVLEAFYTQGGHNGIQIYNGKQSLSIDCHWPADDYADMGGPWLEPAELADLALAVKAC